MKLSIITINFNNRDGLKKTIESIINQTFKDYEWIVIDGGSNDGSKELIEKYKKHITYWVSEPDNGVYHAMNKGLSHVNGEYVNFMNSGDSFYDNNTLNNLFQNKLNCDLIYGDWISIEKNGHHHISPPKDITLDFYLTGNICHQATFIKTFIMKKYGFNEKYKIVADWEVWIKFLLDGYSMHYIQQTICVYDGIDGISSLRADERDRERDTMLESTIPFYLRNVLKKSNDRRLILEEYEKCKLTSEQMLFLKNHPLFLKLLNIRIHLAKKCRELTNNIH